MGCRVFFSFLLNANPYGTVFSISYQIVIRLYEYYYTTKVPDGLMAIWSPTGARRKPAGKETGVLGEQKRKSSRLGLQTITCH